MQNHCSLTYEQLLWQMVYSCIYTYIFSHFISIEIAVSLTIAVRCIWYVYLWLVIRYWNILYELIAFRCINRCISWPPKYKKPLTILAKNSILDIRRSSDYAFGFSARKSQNGCISADNSQITNSIPQLTYCWVGISKARDSQVAF